MYGSARARAPEFQKLCFFSSNSEASLKFHLGPRVASYATGRDDDQTHTPAVCRDIGTITSIIRINCQHDRILQASWLSHLEITGDFVECGRYEILWRKTGVDFHWVYITLVCPIKLAEGG